MPHSRRATRYDDSFYCTKAWEFSMRISRPVWTQSGLWRRKLKPTGVLVVADVIPPDVSPLRDAAALLWFGLKGGFLLAAIGGLVRTALSDYRKVRAQLGLATYSELEFTAILADQGFIADRVRPNFGHNQGRMTFRAVRG